ncbi:DUF3299 domain-containing protein [Paraglaciecola hydrolytica]|uniref:DUF3299 domain-containing protein n=1 Tax=Paraglaciecola hydrolytica TaxID=1799789 RepID=A0A136A4F3_9ALTE|nr:DUF3299 domain-containing protein [Paraglaciecola hydrolytica]KXI30086.1 hypothetical protein AX660_08795 [Paraglaciecola hydrolytica]
MKNLILLICLLSSASINATEPLELFWEDMVPKNYITPEAQVSHDGSMVQQSLDAPVVQSLNGKLVKIPGFVVPLEGDNELTSEFLLVPYFGACIHVPPPPPNQIVYVKFSSGVPISNLYDAVWVTGTLSTASWQGDLATVGYSLTGISLSQYDG